MFDFLNHLYHGYLGYVLIAIAVILILIKIMFSAVKNKVKAKNNSIAIGANNNGIIQQLHSDKRQNVCERVFTIVCGLASILGLFFVFYPIH